MRAHAPYPSKELRTGSFNAGVRFSKKPISYVGAKTLLHVSSRWTGFWAIAFENSYCINVRFEHYAPFPVFFTCSLLGGSLLDRLNFSLALHRLFDIDSRRDCLCGSRRQSIFVRASDRCGLHSQDTNVGLALLSWSRRIFRGCKTVWTSSDRRPATQTILLICVHSRKSAANSFVRVINH